MSLKDLQKNILKENKKISMRDKIKDRLNIYYGEVFEVSEKDGINIDVAMNDYGGYFLVRFSTDDTRDIVWVNTMLLDGKAYLIDKEGYVFSKDDLVLFLYDNFIR